MKKIRKLKKNNFAKKRKKKEKLAKKKRKNTVDYCCNPQCFVYGNSESPVRFSIFVNKIVKNGTKVSV
jgi:hypothetical protein